MRRFGFCLAIVLCVADLAFAQLPFPQAMVPPPGPLMYVRFTGPKGAKITVYRGFDKGQTLELPCKLGFRPGYAYRLAVFDLPNLPRQVFCPTLEIHGTLALVPKARNADFPAHINFSEDEFGRVMAGSFVKKVITLERPDQAIPVASKADRPLEVPVQGTRDPYVEATERGQPLIVLQLGQRYLTPQELNATATPGTILLPGDRVLGTPRRPPYLFWSRCPVFDPLHGPQHASDFVTIFDGGDSGNPAGINRFGKPRGLDPTDTLAEYTDSKGFRRLAASNRVGLCVPRFVVIKSEFRLAAQTVRTSVENRLIATATNAAVGQRALRGQSQQTQAESMKTQIRLSGTFNTLGTSVVGRVQGLKIQSTLRSTKNVDATMAGPKQPEPTDGPLLIIKWPDLCAANVGDVVTFYLKYSNTGGQPITDVVVSDSLAARFEYVKGSAKTDRDARFTTQANEAGSTVLRWEFTSELQPREHGLIAFQVKVR